MSIVILLHTVQVPQRDKTCQPGESCLPTGDCPYWREKEDLKNSLRGRDRQAIVEQQKNQVRSSQSPHLPSCLDLQQASSRPVLSALQGILLPACVPVPRRAAAAGPEGGLQEAEEHCRRPEAARANQGADLQQEGEAAVLPDSQGIAAAQLGGGVRRQRPGGVCGRGQEQ